MVSDVGGYEFDIRKFPPRKRKYKVHIKSMRVINSFFPRIYYTIWYNGIEEEVQVPNSTWSDAKKKRWLQEYVAEKMGVSPSQIVVVWGGI